MVQQKKLRIHSRHLLKQEGDFCIFAIASSDVWNDNQKVIIGQPLLRGHNVVFVHDLPPAVIIQAKKGERFFDDRDGGDYVP